MAAPASLAEVVEDVDGVVNDVDDAGDEDDVDDDVDDDVSAPLIILVRKGSLALSLAFEGSDVFSWLGFFRSLWLGRGAGRDT